MKIINVYRNSLPFSCKCQSRVGCGCCRTPPVIARSKATKQSIRVVDCFALLAMTGGVFNNSPLSASDFLTLDSRCKCKASIEQRAAETTSFIRLLASEIPFSVHHFRQRIRCQKKQRRHTQYNNRCRYSIFIRPSQNRIHKFANSLDTGGNTNKYYYQNN